MIGRNTRHLLLVVLAAVIARAALFKHVGMWGDMGFYTYDARLILAGQTPFVDLVGRSPLFNYAYAHARGIFGYPVLTLRAFINLWWLLAAFPVYGIATRIHSHRAGLAAAAVLLLSPFGLVYGMWANTQSLMALLSILAVYAIVREQSHRSFLIAGVLIGAAFLSRRSVVTFAAGLAIWVGLEAFRHRDGTEFLVRGVTLAGGFFGTIFVGYAALAVHEGDLGLMLPLFETHFVGLLSSSGRGGFPLVTDAKPPSVTNTIDQGRIPIFNDLCQMCGAWTARTFAKTLLVTIPVVGPLFVYFRDWTQNVLIERDRQYLFGVLAALGLYASAMAVWAGYYVRVAAVLSLALFALVAYRAPAIERDVLYDRRLQLVLLTLVMLAAGYLYRNRVIHTYYFMDFLPALAIVSGIIYAEFVGDADVEIVGSISVRQALTVAVLAGIIVSTAGAHPLVVVVTGNDAGWFTVENVQTYQREVPEDAAGQPVFTGHPSYVAGSDARLLFDMPRIHYYANTFAGSQFGDAFFRRLTTALENGRAKIAIAGPMTEAILEHNESAEQAFIDNYCRAPADEQAIYQETGGTLYRYQEECPPSRTYNTNATN